MDRTVTYHGYSDCHDPAILLCPYNVVTDPWIYQCHLNFVSGIYTFISCKLMLYLHGTIMKYNSFIEHIRGLRKVL